jgi:hypothetical protein
MFEVVVQRDGDAGQGVGGISTNVVGSSTATIGSGVEFVFDLKGPNSSGLPTGVLSDIDIQSDGTVFFVGHGKKTIGGHIILPFAFDLRLTFLDPDVEILNATTGGDMEYGTARTTPGPPVIWTIFSEEDSNFGNLLTVSGPDDATPPSIHLTARNLSAVPLPATLPMLGAGLAIAGAFLRRRKQQD